MAAPGGQTLTADLKQHRSAKQMRTVTDYHPAHSTSVLSLSSFSVYHRPQSLTVLHLSSCSLSHPNPPLTVLHLSPFSLFISLPLRPLPRPKQRPFSDYTYIRHFHGPFHDRAYVDARDRNLAHCPKSGSNVPTALFFGLHIRTPDQPDSFHGRSYSFLILLLFQAAPASSSTATEPRERSREPSTRLLPWISLTIISRFRQGKFPLPLAKWIQAPPPSGLQPVAKATFPFAAPPISLPIASIMRTLAVAMSNTEMMALGRIRRISSNGNCLFACMALAISRTREELVASMEAFPDDYLDTVASELRQKLWDYTGASSLIRVLDQLTSRGIAEWRANIRDPQGWGDELAAVLISLMDAGHNPQAAQDITARKIYIYDSTNESLRLVSWEGQSDARPPIILWHSSYRSQVSGSYQGHFDLFLPDGPFSPACFPQWIPGEESNLWGDHNVIGVSNNCLAGGNSPLHTYTIKTATDEPWAASSASDAGAAAVAASKASEAPPRGLIWRTRTRFHPRQLVAPLMR